MKQPNINEMNSGQIINDEESKIVIFFRGLGSLIGVLGSTLLIVFTIIISYVDTLDLDIFRENWYTEGIIIVLIIFSGDLMYNLVRLFKGKNQMTIGLRIISELIGGIGSILLSSNYPFKFGRYDDLIMTALVLLGILRILSAVGAISKFMSYQQTT